MQKTIFTLLCVPVLLGPWLFGAWEAWWFWIFAVFLFAAGTLFGIQKLRQSALPPPDLDTPVPDEHLIWVRRQRTMLLLCMPFLAYAIWSMTRPIIFLTAERSVLIFLTPVLLASIIVFGMCPRERRRLFLLIVINLFLLGLYGILNHAFTGSQYVLWAQGYAQYTIDHRATGSYYCPNHFAGIMEMAAALGLGIMLTRRVSTLQRVVGLSLTTLSCVGIMMSKSRGGGTALAITLLATLHWGFVNWPRKARWWWRIAGVALCGIMLAGVALFAHSFTTRYTEYFRPDTLQNKSFAEAAQAFSDTLKSTSRGRMYASAVRAWKSSPVIGIGPGMHTAQWFHFGPSPDGDAQTFTWPRHPNYQHRSDEVHSDWIELLEEYGLLGLTLILIPAIYLFYLLTLALKQDHASLRERERSTSGTYFPRESMALGALLAYVALMCHSLGDFNLQMPASTWLFAAILALPLGMIGDKRVRSHRT